MRAFRSALVAAALFAFAAPAYADSSVKMSNVTIPASDGVNLSGDVYLPSAHGKFPAVVDMEPYGRSTATPFLQNGYAHVNTDVRGSGMSGGVREIVAIAPDRIQLIVDDTQKWYDRAIAAGFTGVTPPQKMFWGDFWGQARDPFGVTWAFNQPAA